jgi:hypothetical protein
MQGSPSFSRFVRRVALSLSLVVCGCSSSSPLPNGSGGSEGSGGSGSGGSTGGGECSSVAPCGGDVVGSWTVASSCIKVTGNLDLSLSNAGCASAPVTGSLKVEGTWTATADGKYTDNTVTTGSEQFTLGPSCLVISSTPVTCDGAANLLTATLGYDTLT